MDVDDDGNDNDDGGVDDDDGVNINDGNDANGGDSMSKAEYHDNADDGGGNSNNDGSVDGDVLLGIGVLMGKVVRRLIMGMSNLRVLQVTLLNVIEVPKWK